MNTLNINLNAGISVAAAKAMAKQYLSNVVKDILEKELFVISSETPKSDNAETGGMEFPGKVYMCLYPHPSAYGSFQPLWRQCSR